MEYADDLPVRTPPFACENLRRIGVHPGTQVLVGTYDGDQQILTHEHDVFRRILDGKKRYGSQSTFVIGKAVIQVFADPSRDSPPEVAGSTAQPLIPLLPSQARTIDWPPDILVDDQNYDIIRHGAIGEHGTPTQLGRTLLD